MNADNKPPATPRDQQAHGLDLNPGGQKGADPRRNPGGQMGQGRPIDEEHQGGSAGTGETVDRGKPDESGGRKK